MNIFRSSLALHSERSVPIMDLNEITDKNGAI